MMENHPFHTQQVRVWISESVHHDHDSLLSPWVDQCLNQWIFHSCLGFASLKFTGLRFVNFTFSRSMLESDSLLTCSEYESAIRIRFSWIPGIIIWISESFCQDQDSLRLHSENQNLNQWILWSSLRFVLFTESVKLLVMVENHFFHIQQVSVNHWIIHSWTNDSLLCISAGQMLNQWIFRSWQWFVLWTFGGSWFGSANLTNLTEIHPSHIQWQKHWISESFGPEWICSLNIAARLFRGSLFESAKTSY